MFALAVYGIRPLTGNPLNATGVPSGPTSLAISKAVGLVTIFPALLGSSIVLHRAISAVSSIRQSEATDFRPYRFKISKDDPSTRISTVGISQFSFFSVIP